MPPNRSLAAITALGTAAYVLTGCGTVRAEQGRARPSLRATLVIQTPTTRPTSIGTMPEHTSPPPRPSPIRVAACHPSGKAIPVREPSRATTDRVARSWRRIESWLGGHAPKSGRTLRPPAPDAKIAHLQTRLGRALPPDLVASLRVHDGTRDGTDAFTFPPFHVPMTTGRIAAEWHMMCDITEDGGTTYPGDWKPGFTPFALASDGGELYRDQNGRVGEYFAEDGAHTSGYPASYPAFLETTAALLETGRPGPSRFKAHTHDGVLDWKP